MMENEWVVKGGWWIEKRKVVVVRRGQARWGGDGTGLVRRRGHLVTARLIQGAEHRCEETRQADGSGAERQRRRRDTLALGACEQDALVGAVGGCEKFPLLPETGRTDHSTSPFLVVIQPT